MEPGPRAFKKRLCTLKLLSTGEDRNKNVKTLLFCFLRREKKKKSI